MILKSYIVENNINFFKENKCALFYGENLGLKNELKEKILSLEKKDIVRNTQEEILNQEEKFYENLLNISLFDEKKIFIIDNVSDKILETFQHIENKIDKNKIFLFSGILDKKSKLRSYFEKSKYLVSVPCYEDNELNIKKIIFNKLKDFSGLSPEVINMISENSSLNRSKLNNEIKKIKDYFINKKIDKVKLLQLLNLNENNDFNLLKDAALKGNKRITNKLLSETNLDIDKPIFYLNIINQRLNKLNEIQRSDFKTIEKAIDNVKPPIFWKDKQNFLEQAKKWNRKKIREALNKTFNLELMLKSNANIDKQTLIKKLLVDICYSANS